MAMATALFAFLLILPAALADQYTVGDTSGWNQGVNYDNWTKGKTFKVGDTLLFSYGGTHSVDVVSKSDYDNCASGNAISSYSGGSTVVKLDKEGPMNFICPTFGHCSSGMKLAVTVSAASSTTPSGGAPTTTPSGPSTKSPPSSTNTTAPKSSSTAATGNFNKMNLVVGGASIMLAHVLALMG